MYNKLLADLIKERLNSELEKIKLELFEDDYYTQDIEDSVEAVKREMLGENKDYQPVDIVQAPVIPEPQKEPIAQIIEVTTKPVQEAKPEPVKEEPIKFKEINLTQEETESLNDTKQLAQKLENINTIPEKVDMVKVGAATIIFIALLAGAYFYFFR